MHPRILLALLGAFALSPPASLRAAPTPAPQAAHVAKLAQAGKSHGRLQLGLDAMASAAAAKSLTGVDAYRRAYPRAHFAAGKGGTTVAVDMAARTDPQVLAARLAALGAEHVAIDGRMLSARVPVSALSNLAAESELAFARPVMARAWRGTVLSQGDFAIRGPLARPPTKPAGPTGSGVEVGVMSDSFDCEGGAFNDVANDEYNPVDVLKEEADCSIGTDEGRAMVQIVADVAPDASLSFRTAFDGQADFARGIKQLADNGADVIVDDIGYFAEPYFHDGIIAQAVDRVFARGIPYFSAAANSGRMSYESVYRPVAVTPVDQDGAGFAHDFSPGGAADIYQRIFIDAGQTITLGFQWDDAFLSSDPTSPGADGDLDIYLLSAKPAPGADLAPLIVATGNDFNVGNDAVEILDFTNDGAGAFFYIRIDQYEGNRPGRIKYVDFGSGDALAVDFPTSSSTLAGHPNAKGAFAVGAAPYDRTPECGVTPAQREDFSSAGGTRILLKPNGAKQTSEIRSKPDATGPDGANTSFFGSDIPNPGGVVACRDTDGRPNFFGTSAAAPHVAGVAALMRQKKPTATPTQIYGALRATASDMGEPGFDFDTGFGFVRADDAVAKIATAKPTVTLSRAKQAVQEGLNGQVTLALNTTSAVDVSVTLSRTGTAKSGVDYTAFATTVTIPAHTLSKTITIRTIEDTAVEPNETVILTIASATKADIGLPDSYKLTIQNDD